MNNEDFIVRGWVSGLNALTVFDSTGAVTTANNTLDDGATGLATLLGLTIQAGYHLNPAYVVRALGVNPPISGTVYHNTSGGPLLMIIPVTATAIGGSVQLALGSSGAPPAWGGAAQIGVSGELHNYGLLVPDAWYWSVTVTSATIGTVALIGC